jgi:mannose-6-phosphate isomerase-like protein (cupin superfamily)
MNELSRTRGPEGVGDLTSSRSTTAPEAWAEGCRAWRLVEEAGFAVAEEEMAPGTQEEWHTHDLAAQYFYVLEGELEVRLREGTVVLRGGHGALIQHGLAHQVANRSSADVRFLVTSVPGTRSDRRVVAGPSRAGDR